MKWDCVQTILMNTEESKNVLFLLNFDPLHSFNNFLHFSPFFFLFHFYALFSHYNYYYYETFHTNDCYCKILFDKKNVLQLYTNFATESIVCCTTMMAKNRTIRIKFFNKEQIDEDMNRKKGKTIGAKEE